MAKSKKVNKQKPVQFSITINDIPLSKSQIKEIEFDLNNVVTRHLNNHGDIAGYYAINNFKNLIPDIVKNPPSIIRGITISRLNDVDLKNINNKLWKNLIK